MKYSAKKPNEDVNLPQEHIVPYSTKLIVSFILSMIIAYVILLGVVDIIIQSITPKQEKALTNLISKEIKIATSKTKADMYIQKVVDKLAKCSDIPYKLDAYIMQDKQINAFALPGGTIYITTGMLKIIKSENELASVMGHEIGHFKNKDHLRSFSTSIVTGFISLFIPDSYSSMVNGMTDFSKMKFSQVQEEFADKFGIDAMNCAYGNVNGATILFEKMDRGNSELEHFMASHPSFKSRIKKMKDHIKDKNYIYSNKLIPFNKD